jgi:phosphoribosylformimino-5-aminoimidazole carboxamide ribotide isomerase
MRWHTLGATRLHVIDLDGAETGEQKNIELIKLIAVFSPIQVGGGIRTMEAIENLIKINVDRVILGSIAVEKPEMVKEACHRFGEMIIGGIDVRDGKVAIHGWQEQTELELIEYARGLAKLGVRRFVFTDISRDGTLTEPNFTQTFELIESVGLPVIGSGGIASLSHLKLMEKIGAEGVIIGKALYTGDINLKQALSAVNKFGTETE